MAPRERVNSGRENTPISIFYRRHSQQILRMHEDKGSVVSMKGRSLHERMFLCDFESRILCRFARSERLLEIFS